MVAIITAQLSQPRTGASLREAAAKALATTL
jgi:hypothetical protein